MYRIRGGYSAKSGARSVIEVNSIIATRGDTRTLERNRDRYTPPLNNRTLFKRDANLCMYCGLQFRASELTRDHITPISRGGRDVWTNVVTACRRCNNHKANLHPLVWEAMNRPKHVPRLTRYERKVLALQRCAQRRVTRDTDSVTA